MISHKKSLLFQVGFPLMTFALIIKVYCCLKQHSDLTEILYNKIALPIIDIQRGFKCRNTSGKR
ncbi:hypothetical protein FQK04_16355 [Acinetobacter baumannii]|nr:hypothetical protein FQK04_16355 [Acinetobacter baumannii]